MIYGMYQSAAGMMVNEYRQSVVTNNLANAQTTGFKRDVATFAERLHATRAGRRDGPSDPTLDTLTGGTWLGRTHTDFSEGQIVRTGQPLDVALAGPGFLRVRDDQGQRLTRDCRMIMAPDGHLVAAADGAEILGEAGQPLRVNPRGGDVRIDEVGGIWQDDVRVGRLGVVDVRNPDRLRKVAGGRFDPAGLETLASPAAVMAGFTESAGVEPVHELVNMLEASRAYQFNAQMLSLQDQSAARLINLVAAG